MYLPGAEEKNNMVVDIDFPEIQIMNADAGFNVQYLVKRMPVRNFGDIHIFIYQFLKIMNKKQVLIVIPFRYVAYF